MNSPSRTSIRQRLAQLVVLVLVSATPWYFGGVTLTCVCLVGFGTIVLGALVLLSGVSDSRLPVAALVLLAAVGLGLWQLVSLPQGVLQAIAPGTASWYETLLGELSVAPPPEAPAGEGTLHKSTLSVAPIATRRTTATLVMAVIVFLGSFWVFRNEFDQRIFLGVLTVNGALLAAFGIVQMLTWNGHLYWYFPSPVTTAFGPFVNRNNAAGFLGISLAAAVGLVSGAASETSHPRRRHERGAFGGKSTWLSFAQLVDSPVSFAALVGACIIMAGILCSLSRGGIIACALGLMFWLVVDRQRINLRGPIPVVVGLILLFSAFMVWWVARSDELAARLTTLQSSEILTSNNRLPVWRDAARAIPDFLPWGAGLGTFQYVSSPFRTQSDDRQFAFAENQYFQAMVEGGIPGFLFLAGAIALTGYAFSRGLARSAGAQRGTIVAGVIALVIQAVHGFTDFGLYHSSSALAFASIVAVGLAACPAGSFAVVGPAWHVKWVNYSAVAIIWLVLVNIGAFASLLRAREVEMLVDAMDESVEEFSQWDAPRIERSASDLRAALANCWDHPEGHLQAAEMTLSRLSRIAPALELSGLETHGVTSGIPGTMAIYRAIYQLESEGRDKAVQTLRESDAIGSLVQNARDHLLAALEACPFLAEAHLELGFIGWLWSPDDKGEKHFARVRLLSPRNGAMRYYAGWGELFSGRPERCALDWRECLLVSPSHKKSVRDMADEFLPSELVAAEILPDSPGELVEIVRARYSKPDSRELREAALVRLEKLIESRPVAAPETDYLWGALYLERQEIGKAATHLRAAVAARPEKTEWRYELASLLARSEEWSEAQEHASWCIKHDPQNSRFAALMRNILKRRLPAITPR